MGILKRLIPRANPERFARLVMKQMRAKGVSEPLTYEAADFCITIGEGNRHFLSNAYRDYLDAPLHRRREVIDRYARLPLETGDLPERKEEALPHLLPRIRERFYYESLRLMLRRQGKPFLFAPLPFSEDLIAEIVFDRPTAIQNVLTENLAGWGLDMAGGMKVARENLWQISKENFIPLANGVYRSGWQDTHDASRLILHDLIWQLKVRGRHVAMVPNRNLLLITGSDDPEGLAMIGILADGVLQEPRPMSGVAVVLDGDRWLPFLPTADHPAYQPLRRAAMRSESISYNAQTDLLKAVYENTGEDIFVPKQIILQKADGSWQSLTTWVEPVTDAMMPRADTIVFARADRAQPQMCAEWNDVAAVAGELMEPVDLYPVRYRVRRFPSQDQLAKLNLRPVTST